MQSDFRSLPDDQDIDCQLCIVGGGAAGIAIAKEFVGTAISVCLVESGGLEWEDDIQALYAGETRGTLPPRDLVESRLRFFGGTTNIWAGCCAPLNDIDFEKKPWVPHSGWPIDKAELTPFYARAQAVCELGPFEYGERLWHGLEPKALPFDQDRIVTRFYQESPPTNFAEVHGPALQSADNINVILHANVLGFRTDGQVESVNHVDIATLSGKRGRVRAKYFVLACGGVENARLLLLSNDVKPNGLGNDRDQVGRFYMDHLFGRIGHAWTADPDIWERHGLTEHDHETTSEFARVSGDPLRVRPFAVLSEAWQRRHEVLNIGLLADKVEKDEETFPLSRKNGPLLDFRASLVGLSETAPNKDSRVMLSGEKDPLGLRRVLLDWRLSEIDLRTQAAMAQAFGTEMARLNIARMRIDDWIETQDWSAAIGRNDEPLTGSSHHMGTTRMSDTPVDGVVNRHCAVHDLHNMYIAGSSVFPTCGFVNPTLTIVALALRVADQLKQKLAYP